ncbi:protein phosphatase, partial [Streptomyces sp. SID5475]|nr:protein phosphatase [Streptomyces sp. SID5475]
PQFTGDLEQLEKDATGLGNDADDIRETGKGVHTQFQGLSAFYTAPEAEALFASTKPVQDRADEFADDLEKVKSALDEYAAEVRPLVAKLKQLKADAAAFVASVEGDDEWKYDGDKIDEHNALQSDVTATVAAFWEAERTAANKITALVGGTQYRANDGSDGKNMYGFSADDMKDAEVPWGTAENEKYHWYEVHQHIKSFVWDGLIVDGVWGTIKGLGTLVGFDGWDAMKDAWKGLGMLVVGTALYTSPLAYAVPDSALPQWMKDSKQVAKEAGKAMLAWDTWKENPARAAGAVTFNVLTTATGVGNVAKGGTAAKAAALVSKTGKVIDPMTYVAGAAGKVTKISDVLGGLKNMFPEKMPELPNMANMPDGTVKLPDGSLLSPDGTLRLPDGTVNVPNSSALPNGSLLPDGWTADPHTAPSAAPAHTPAPTPALAHAGAPDPGFPRRSDTPDTLFPSAHGDALPPGGVIDHTFGGHGSHGGPADSAAHHADSATHTDPAHHTDSAHHTDPAHTTDPAAPAPDPGGPNGPGGGGSVDPPYTHAGDPPGTPAGAVDPLPDPADWDNLTPEEMHRLASWEVSQGTVPFVNDADAARYGAAYWNDYADSLSPSQKEAFLDYTKETNPGGVTYHEINGFLRGDSAYDTPAVRHDIAEIDRAMAARPVPEDVMVVRGTGLGHLNLSSPLEMEGRVFDDGAYMSTSLGDQPVSAFAGKEAVLHLRVPQGTPATWVERVSAFGGGERELLLARGSAFKVTRVFWDNGQWQVYGEILPRP